MTSKSEPIQPFGDGRHKGGRFAKGNSGGPGNPHGKHVALLRSAILATVTIEDIQGSLAPWSLWPRAGTWPRTKRRATSN
jgi:hypothetical protein